MCVCARARARIYVCVCVFVCVRHARMCVCARLCELTAGPGGCVPIYRQKIKNSMTICVQKQNLNIIEPSHSHLISLTNRWSSTLLRMAATRSRPFSHPVGCVRARVCVMVVVRGDSCVFE